MEKYSSAVSEMYSQFKKKEAHPLEKYIGKLVRCYLGNNLEVVGYSYIEHLAEFVLIVDVSTTITTTGGWAKLDPNDVIFKECKSYWYIRISDLID